MILHSYCRYRQVSTWEDKTVEYYSDIFHRFSKKSQRPKCGFLQSASGHLHFITCGFAFIDFRKYLCQMPERLWYQRTQSLSLVSQRSAPSLAEVNVTVTGQRRREWWPVICPDGHVTHMFMTCDMATFCWAEGEITLNSDPDSWALPTSQSCPARLVETSLPPSFRCQSEKQHVPYSLVCDHRQDCLDGSDETVCVFLPCQQQFQFQCLNRQVCLTMYSRYHLRYKESLLLVFLVSLNHWV